MTLAVQRDLGSLRAGLERWLERPVSTIARSAPGWSCETLIVDEELVIRLPPAGPGIFPSYDLAQQAAVQSAVGAAGVPVAPGTRHEADESFLGAPFVAMELVVGPIPGELTAADEWLLGLPDDAARRSVWQTLLGAVVALHRTPAADLGLRSGLDAELDHWDGYIAWATDGSPPPGLADALAWCRANRPPEDPPLGLLWGDVRLGNVVFDDVGLTPKAVLDWDMASVGPLEMDLAWFLALEALQTDLTQMAVPGFGTRAEAIALVEAGIDRKLMDLDWYETFALVRASAISTRIAILFREAGQRSMFALGKDPSLAAALRRCDINPGR